jgi:translation initiation factor 5B
MNDKHSMVAAKGILTSVMASALSGFVITILFLFCIPDLDTIFALNAPQPFVQIYVLALGKEGSVVMTIIAVIGLIVVCSILLGNKTKHFLIISLQNTTITILAASRLIFAVARDGVLPLSGWIGQVDSNGQPKNAVTVIYIFGAVVLCTILPSQVAFTSLVSASIIPCVAAYALISILRLTMTPNHFQSSHFHLGRFAKPFYVCAVLINGIIAAVCIALAT